MNKTTPCQNVDALAALHTHLGDLIGMINDAPGRYDDTPQGLLAEAGYYALSRAAMVVHRLMLWAKYPAVSPESYFTAGEEGAVEATT